LASGLTRWVDELSVEPFTLKALFNLSSDHNQRDRLAVFDAIAATKDDRRIRT
jgi:hypothetical protein